MEYHDNRGTFFGQCETTFALLLCNVSHLFYNSAVVIDRSQSTNEGVENSTMKVDDKLEHYEYLERFDTGDRYIVRE